MDHTSDVAGREGQAPESLQALARYLEVSLDKGACVVVMRDGASVFTAYIGNPGDEENKLKRHETVPTAVANEMLALTQPGANRFTIGDETYRFFRSFTDVNGVGAVVFTPQ